MKRILRSAGSVLMLLAAGCMLPGNRAVNSDVAPSFQVKCAGECLELETAARSNRHALISKAEELLKEKRLASLVILVERNTEEAIECLRQRNVKQDPSAAEVAVARALDKLMKHPDDGWAVFIQGRKRGNVADADGCLRNAQELARSQQWSQVVKILTSNEAAVSRCPYHGVQASLLRSEALRHLGKNKEAIECWQKAVTQAAGLGSAVQVPGLWEKLAGQRPVSAVWPNEIHALARTLPGGLHATTKSPAFAPEFLVWFSIGQARLARGEAAEALTAFKRCDSNSTCPEWDDFLILHQAKALLAMQQTPAATGLLTGLIDRPAGSSWRASALTILGSGKLSDGHVEQALAFLQEAVAAPGADNLWRADAVANLGLAHLMNGNETNGISSLRDAQERFQQAADFSGLLLCLENEASYWQKMGRSGEHRQAFARITEVESRAR